MAAQRVLGAAAMGQTFRIDCRGLTAKVDGAQKMADAKEHAALVASGNGDPVPCAVVSAVDRVHLGSARVDGRHRWLRPRTQSSQPGSETGVNCNRSSAFPRG